jgi:hypothetical protein
MNISLSKNEKIALFAVVFVIIAVAGTFIFLLPNFEKVSASRAIENERKERLESLNRDFGLPAFQAIEDDIIKAYEDGKDASENFYGETFTSYNADRLVRRVLSKMDLEIDNVQVNAIGLYNLTLTQFAPSLSWTSTDDEAIIYSDEQLDDLTAIAPIAEFETRGALRYFMRNATRQQALDFYDAVDKTPEFLEAMRGFLAEESQEFRVQSARFNIALTDEQAEELSMHIFKLHELPTDSDDNFYGNTYISNFSASTDQQADELSDDEQYYVIDILFFIVRPMQTPRFDYETKFTW